MLARQERYRLKACIKIGEEILHPLFAAVGQGWDLIIVVWTGDRAAFKARRCIANGLHDRCKSLLLDASLPHRYQRTFLGRFAMERLLRMDFLDVAQNSRHFADRGTVLKHQRGDDATRIDRAIGIAMLLALPEVDG